MENIPSEQTECHAIHPQELKSTPIHFCTADGFAHEMIATAIGKSTQIPDTCQPQLGREILIRGLTRRVDESKKNRAAQPQDGAQPEKAD